ncbi:virginiamycin B lyase family protein [Methanocella sp. MCL-LM]|uniref:virginiamycin B lyase family protein n=1 Tax=Methanocella sp. MCL-LM TaxID=3412035 RepID=UPI003C78C458
MAGRRLLVLIILMAVLATLFSAAACADQTYSVTEYPLPADSTGASAMAIDSSGDVWLIQDSPAAIYRLSRDNGSFSRYVLEGFDNAGFAGMSVDAEGNAWFADLKGNRVGAYTPSTNHTSTFSFPGPMAPSSVIREGNTLWIGCKEEVGELNLVTDEFSDHFVYKMDSYLYDIEIDRLGNVWFVENRANKVGTYYRAYDTNPEFDIPTPDAYPTCLSIDGKGRLWFIESGPNKLGMFDTDLFSFAEYNMTPVDGKMPVFSDVVTIGDSVWVTDSANGRVLKFYPDEGRFSAAELGNGTVPTLLEADSEGVLWTYEASSKKLASLEILEGFGVATPTPAPTPTSTPLPTSTPTGTPAPAPGFEFLIATFSLLAVIFIKSR